MMPDADDVRRVSLGDGIYVHVASAGHEQVEPAPAPTPRSDGADRSDPAPAATPSWTVTPFAVRLGAGAGLLALLRLGVTGHGVLAAGVLAVLGVLSAIDMRWRVLPNRIVLPATAAVLVWQIAFFPDRSAEWVLATLGAAALLVLPSLFQRGAIGMGDVKLAGLLGATLGASVLSALMLGFLAIVPAALVMLVRRGAAARRATLPLGPFLALGAAIVLLT
jgi:prepilin signal peptidase PulO-like enzyme (type II secretory pathway)